MLDAILVYISTSYIHKRIRSEEFQLGLYYIAEYAHMNNLNVGVKKYSSSDSIIGSLSAIIEKHKCRIVGFYVDSENMWTIRRLLLNLKKTFPQLFVMIGGPQVTGDAQLALKRIPYVDCAIVGEGERPVTELIKQFKKGEMDYSIIRGVAYNDSSNRYCFTGSQFPIHGLEEYPYPRRKEYALDENVVFDQILTGRGCVGQCAFCFEGNKKENVLRLRTVESVVEEIDYVISYLGEHKFISFLDDTFIINPSRTEAICKHLINKYNGEIGWFCEARVDVLMRNLHLLPLMKAAGLIRIQLGGESGSQKVLDVYKKNMQIEHLITVVKEIYKAGIPSVFINFIVGGAFETLTTFNETIELAKHLLTIAPGCAEVECSLLSPYVGTPIRNKPNVYGLRLIDKELLRGPDGYMPCVETEQLTEQKILQLKAIFDAEVLKKSREVLGTLSDEQLLVHYEMEKRYSIMTNWYSLCQNVESYKNYFEAIVGYGFLSIRNLTLDELSLSVPYRTVQPVSDGETYLRTVAFVGNVKNSELENTVFFLSSGKISFYEIVQILSRSDKFKHIDNLESAILDVYKQFDKERLIVWKNCM